MGSNKAKVLRLGTWPNSREKWQQLGQIAEIIDCQSSNRKEFLEDLKGKYSDVTNIARTFGSVEQTGRFDEEIAKALPDSVVSVSHCGAGYDQVEPMPLLERKIQLSNVTTPVEAPTALTAVYLVLATLRNFQEGHELMVQGKWPQQPEKAGAKRGRDPEGLTVGILGMGGIGRAIRDRLTVFGFEKMIYHNRSRLSGELEGGAEYASFNDVLKESDVILVSVPLNKHTKHLIDEEAIDKMKDGVVVVNTARGAVIDEKAILNKLKEGKIGAFGADVFENEPEVLMELLKLSNVVSLPHMGTFTEQAMRNMENFVVDNVENQIKTGKVLTIVPEHKSLV